MARDHKVPGNSVLAAMRQEIDDLKREVSLLKRRTTTTLQQIDVTQINDPIEGQEVIDHTDDKHKWYSNGQWREPQASAGGDLPWCRWRNLEEKVVDSTFFEADADYEVINNYPEVFETVESGIRRTKCLTDGIYAMNYRILWAGNLGAVPPHGVTLCGIDPDFWENYSIQPGPIDQSIMAETGSAGSYITRLKGNIGGGVFPVVRFYASPFEHEAYEGTHFEIIRLGDATGIKLNGAADD